MLWAFALIGASAAAAQPVATGAVVGTVNNANSGNLLQGVKVEIPALGLVALTDNTGRYVLANVPAGSHDLVTTYTGLDAMRSSVAVAAGQRAVRDFELTTGVYKLAEFKVSGEREGAAAAITAQRNADVVVVNDAHGEFARTVPYATNVPRPVAGAAGPR